jgi:hypothetical protein
MRGCSANCASGRTTSKNRSNIRPRPYPDERIYTFWKYFRNAFARNAGLRIDHLLLSPSLAGRLVAAGWRGMCGAAKDRATMPRSGLNLRMQKARLAAWRGRGNDSTEPRQSAVFLGVHSLRSRSATDVPLSVLDGEKASRGTRDRNAYAELGGYAV